VNVVEVEHLGRVYGSGHTAVTAIDNIDLTIAAGDILLIMGPSGSGKTTLISLIGTLLTPSTGRVRIDGEDTAALSDKQLAGLRLRKLGFMFQSFNLLSALTAEANVALPLLLNGVNRKAAQQRARSLLTNLHLENSNHGAALRPHLGG